MVLEATMICLDYSEWMRNGDYTPTRLEAQRDAVISICLSKLRSNPESTVGILRSSGRGIEVLATLTTDSGRLLSSMHDHNVNGCFDFPSAILVSRLALKHRQNKSQQQRIIAFIGSPVTIDTNKLKEMAVELKRNSISVDIINFGEETENIEKLETFISTVNQNDNSHLLTIPPGPHNLSDALFSSPILDSGEGMGYEAGSTGGGAREAGGSDFGVDPNIDPELAMALRLSLEEERARQQRANQEQPQPQQQPSTSTNEVNMEEEEEEDDDLAQALALSVQTHQQDLAKQTHTSNKTNDPKVDEDVDMEEDDDVQKAMALSLQPEQNNSFQNAQNLSDVISNLPGLDANDPQIQEVLSSLGKQTEQKKDENNDNEKK